MKCVYAITNKTTGKTYVGSTCQFRIRRNTHIRELRKHIHSNYHLQRSFDKYGEDDFEWFVLEEVKQGEELLIRESIWINFLDVIKHGFNIAKDTQAAFKGRKHTEETKKIMSIAKINNKNSCGRKKSDSHKLAISVSMKGRKNALGCKRSEETKRKMRKAQKNRRLREKSNDRS